MTLFLGLGIAGIALLLFALIFDGLLESLFDGFSAMEGLFDGWLSLPVIAGFTAMLGFGGAITLGTTGLGAAAATGVGVVAGAGAAWLTWKFSRALMRDQTDATPRGEDLVGSSGLVVTAIPAQGYGEVIVHLGGQPVKYAAKSATPVARGADVWVESTLSTTSLSVRPIER
jgi:membrane protein implicated in regulation of membrane protease activity